MEAKYREFKGSLRLSQLVLFTVVEMALVVYLISKLYSDIILMCCGASNTLSIITVSIGHYFSASYLASDICMTIIGIYKNFYIYLHRFTPSELSEEVCLYACQNYGDNLDTLCENIRHKRYEIVGYFNFAGQKVQRECCQWHRDYACFSVPSSTAIRGLVMVHNHPSSNRFRKSTNSFSCLDLMAMCGNYANVHVVVGKHFDYVIAAFDKWANDASAVRSYYRLQSNLYLSSYKSAKRESSVTDGLTRKEFVTHNAMCDVASRFDYCYMRFSAGELKVSEEVAIVREYVAKNSQRP